MTVFTVATYKDTQTALATGDWLVVSYFGSIQTLSPGAGAVQGAGANAIQVDGLVSNQTDTGLGIRLTGANNTVVVGINGLVQGRDDGLSIEGGGNTISCAGTIRGFETAGVTIVGSDNAITIGATGTVSGHVVGVNAGPGTTFANFGTVTCDNGYGVFLLGRGNTMTNAGTIEAAGYAVTVGGGVLANSLSNTVVNTGFIRSGFGIAAGDGSTALFNSGTIESWSLNAYTALGTSAVINNGLMFSRATTGIALRDATDTVINNGLIQGRSVAASLGGGNDLFDGRLGVQVGLVSGEAGNDTLYGGAQSDMLAGGLDSDTLYGMGGVDALAGGDGGDTLYGGDGADNLMGEAGTDLIYGGTGGDVIRGGLGGDLIVFNVGDNGDLIQNFNEGGARDGFDLRGYFNATGYTGTTPRAAGIMAVLHNGADTDVYLHGAFAFRLQGVTAPAIDDTYFLFQ